MWLQKPKHQKLKIQRKLKNFNSNVKTKINNEIKRKGKKGFIWEIIFSFLIFCASAVLIFVLYIIISAPNFEKDKLYKKEATVIYDKNGIASHETFFKVLKNQWNQLFSTDKIIFPACFFVSIA